MPRGGERLIVGYASLIELEVPHTRLGRRDEHKHSLGEHDVVVQTLRDVRQGQSKRNVEPHHGTYHGAGGTP